jgi:hypothetical protein
MVDLNQTNLFELPEEEASDAPRSKKFPVRSHEDLKQLAKDVATGKVFMDRFFREGEIEMLGHVVFMPMAFMDWSDWTDEDKAQFGGIYEYFDKAGPRSINGYPCFFSCSILHIDDLRSVFRMARKIQETLDSL